MKAILFIVLLALAFNVNSQMQTEDVVHFFEGALSGMAS